MFPISKYAKKCLTHLFDELTKQGTWQYNMVRYTHLSHEQFQVIFPILNGPFLMSFCNKQIPKRNDAPFFLFFAPLSMPFGSSHKTLPSLVFVHARHAESVCGFEHRVIVSVYGNWDAIFKPFCILLCCFVKAQ